MFTGLIQSLGTVVAVEERPGTRRIKIAAPEMAASLNTGASIAVSGVCLTALDIHPESDPPAFHADLAAETLARTSLATLRAGAIVNLELPTPAGAPLGGHIVQGHVDGTGTLLSLETVSETTPGNSSLADWWMEVSVPAAISRYVVEKGSIAIEGISLTIARFSSVTRDGDVVSIAILPHTYLATNLHTLRPGDAVNIEADVLMKLALKTEEHGGFKLTLQHLVAHGY